MGEKAPGLKTTGSRKKQEKGKSWGKECGARVCFHNNHPKALNGKFVVKKKSRKKQKGQKKKPTKRHSELDQGRVKKKKVGEPSRIVTK